MIFLSYELDKNDHRSFKNNVSFLLFTYFGLIVEAIII